MNIRKFTFALYVGIFIIAIISVLIPLVVQAQCDPATGACPLPPPPSGGGGKKNPPTPIPPQPIKTQTPTSTFTSTPTISDFAWTQTTQANANQVATALCSAYQTVTPANVVNWYPCGTPTATVTPHVFVPPVAGPTILRPGVINIIIAVLIIIVCLGGGFLFFRGGIKPPNPNKPPSPNFDGSDQFAKIEMGDGSVKKADDLNPQPLPPKGIGDGSSQFAKFEDGSRQFDKDFPNDSNQFAKLEDGSRQFGKVFPDESDQIGSKQLK